jgi:hypothetical protein
MQESIATMENPRTLSKRLEDHSSAIVCLGTLAFLYLSLFRFPCTPIYIGGDQNYFLIGAIHLLEGQVIYRDFFEHVAPGLTLVDFVFFKLFGPLNWVPNVLLILVGTGLTWVITAISRRLLSGTSALLPAAVFLILGFGSNLDNTHQWYSALSELCAVALLMERRTPARIAAAGALCGVAAFFTQSQGAFALMGLLAFLLWEGRQEKQRWKEILRRLVYLSIPFAGTVFATFAYFVWKAGLSRIAYCLVEFNIKYYSANYTETSPAVVALEFPEMTHWPDLIALTTYMFLHLLLPFVYLGFWFAYRRRFAGLENRNRLMLVTIAGTFLFAAVSPSPSEYRMWAVAPLGLILLVWLIVHWNRYRSIFSFALWFIVLAWAILIPLQSQTSPMQPLSLPRGTLEVEPLNYSKLSWLASQTHPGEYVFAAASGEVLFPLGVRDPTPVRYLTPTAFTRPEQVSNVIAALEAHQTPMILSYSTLGFREDDSDQLNTPPRGYLRSRLHSIKAFLIGGNRAREDNLGPLRYYVRTHYYLAKLLADETEVWERVK